MLYNGFVVIDTREPSGNQAASESGFGGDPTADPILYGGTLPEITVTPTPKTPAPIIAPPPSTGSGGGVGQWINPQTVAAGAGLIGSVASAIAANKSSKSPDASRIKAVCGRKPLFNTKGKKDKYNQCVQNLMAPQPVYNPAPQQTGMSSSTKIIIGVVAAVVLIGIIITVIVLMKHKKPEVAA